MGQLIVPNGAQVRIAWWNGHKNVYNVLGGILPVGPVDGPTIANNLFTAASAAHVSSGLAALQPVGSLLVNVGFRDVRFPNLPEFTSTGTASNGSAPGSAMPDQIALCLTLRTAMAGRKFRGRIYVPNWAQAASDAQGVATAGAVTAALTFFESFQDAMDAQNCNLAVMHRPVYNEAVTPPVLIEAGFVTEVTQIVSRNTTFETQRRRSPTN